LWARPEYALKTTTVSCSACHLNPFGGGARTVFGKAYGSFGKKLAPFSKQDLFSADIRALGYFPQSNKVKTSGFTLMNVQGTINAPLSPAISDEPDEITKTNLVINFTSPELNQLSGESFILIEPNPNLQFVVGKFARPFGLLTDEHRTYIRMQTFSSLRDYESGIGMSHEIFETIHFDLTYTNTNGVTSEPTWGKVFNLRWTPYFVPFMFGISTSHHERPSKNDSYAQSFYGGYSFDRATQYNIPITLTFEASHAKGWNNVDNSKLEGFLFSSSDLAFKNSIARKDSLGFYSQILWNVRPHLSLLYKYDQLTLDDKYPADAFERHGIGLNWNLNANLIFQVRTEYAKSGRSDLNKSSKGALDSLYFIVRAWM